MRVVVCVRKLLSGELNPFDACCYEAALQIPGAEVILLSMGPDSVRDFLIHLSRLGAARAVLLSDNAFAGADTLATAYTLTRALKRLSPDLILCGRQTIDGDTGQVGPEIAAMAGYPLITEVMSLTVSDNRVQCTTRSGDTESAPLPALLTLERINTLRLPGLRSKPRECEVWNAADLEADPARIGLNGSPTRVIESFQNDRDRRNCRFVSPADFPSVLKEALQREVIPLPPPPEGKKLTRVWAVTESPLAMGRTVSDDITVIPLREPAAMAETIRYGAPTAVLWGSDARSKRIAPQVAAMLGLGLCADCTSLETDGESLLMYRPAFSGNIIAKIRCLTTPAMATVRTAESGGNPLMLGLGYGVRAMLPEAMAFAERIGAEITASRKMVDQDYLPYSRQVGVTGKTVSPQLYIAAGISGAVHHIAGIRGSGTVIAVNPDPDAEIFKYADYGIVASFAELLILL